MKYPWSDIPKPLLRVISQGDPKGAYLRGQDFCKRNGISWVYAGLDRTVPACVTLEALAHWMAGKRAIVRVSKASQELLGSWAPRFTTLPVLLDYGWRQGMIFSFEDLPIPTMMYVEPMEGLQPGICYAMWMQMEWGSWATLVPKSFQEVRGVHGITECLSSFTDLDHAFSKAETVFTEDGRVMDVSTAARHSPQRDSSAS